MPIFIFLLPWKPSERICFCGALSDCYPFPARMKIDPTSLPPAKLTASVAAWFLLAAHPATMRRASLTALIVGVVLIVINHGPAIVSGQLTRARLVQIGLTVFVPYIVSTVSSVATRREMATKSGGV
jgi:hypothetical protein